MNLLRILRSVAAPAGVALGLAACAGPGDAGLPAGRMVITVAPLELPGVTDASYTVSVASAAGPVWSRTLTSSQYGAAGGLSYVGPCDADAGENTVSLVLDGISVAAGPLTAGIDFANPAPAGAPLELRALCVADADVAVRFDLTVARAARQGFFDVAIAFDDLFCSAKLDCQKDGGAPLTLLANPLTGQRDLTAVVGFACTGGLGAATELCFDPLTVACEHGGPFVIDPAGGPGNLNPPFTGAAGELLFQAAVYRGTELLTSGATSWGKTYWNVALGLNQDAFATLGVCTLTAGATASSGALVGQTTPTGTRWPVVSWEVALTDGDAGLAGLSCTRHGLDEPGSGVATVYADDRVFGACTSSACANGAQDPGETDVDCGGDCPPCGEGEGCLDAEDCTTGLCAAGECTSPSCNDGVANGDEAGVDCGGSCPDACLSGDTLYDVITAAPTLASGTYTFIVHSEPIDVEYYAHGATTISASTTLGSATADSRMVVARYDGNLTVASGATLTTATRKKGLVLWVRGALVVNGVVSMTGRGAKAAGQEVWLYRAPDDSAVVVPAGGASGGAARWSNGPSLDGNAGSSGVSLKGPGGGGSGASHCNSCISYSGAGAAATSYSGGSGGGGVSRYYSSGNAVAGAAQGGAGGVASAYHPTDGYGKAAGGGAGNPGGAGRASALGSGAAGGSGAGGLLVIFAEGDLTLGGRLEAEGLAGGGASSGPTQWNAGGGGSGGGAVHAYYGGVLTLTGGTASAAGGAGGQGSCHEVACMRGGAGGTGYVGLEPFTPCATCGRCAVAADCESGVCTLGYCVAASCTDGVRNGDETCVDAGGSCPTRCPGGDTFYDALRSDPTLAAGSFNLRAGATVLPIEHLVYGATTIAANTNLGSTTADQRSLVVRYDGDLTINAGATLTAAARKRGMFLWVRGDLVVNGSLSMTARGAMAAGSNVPLVRRPDTTVFTVPAAGAAGGAAVGTTNGALTGNAGSSGTLGRTGGGASGGVHCNSCTGSSGAGAAGTSWSGGAGGGGRSQIPASLTVGAGAANGGAGGAGVAYQSGSTYAKAGGGGAGNPGGATPTSGSADCAAALGGAGTGGLLVVYVEGTVTVTGTVTSRGSAGGGVSNTHGDCWAAGGGGSGGGSVNVFHRGAYGGTGSVSAAGGAGGLSYCGGSGTVRCMNGGDGGAGSVLVEALAPPGG